MTQIWSENLVWYILNLVHKLHLVVKAPIRKFG